MITQKGQGGQKSSQLRLIANDIAKDAKAMETGIDNANKQVTGIRKDLAFLATKMNDLASDAQKQEMTARQKALEADLALWTRRAAEYKMQADSLHRAAESVKNMRSAAVSGAEPQSQGEGVPAGTATKPASGRRAAVQSVTIE